ncbi:MAG: hypothetical protein NC299_08915 [Lachnospiraceae bacterium]|nr:hypothetical protein [Lachnospiraceae bacterium]
MKTQIERIDKALASNGKWTWKELDIQPTFGEAYRYSIEAENELPNFSDIIWIDDIDRILDSMKREGVTEFTISSTFSSLIDTIGMLIEKGCSLKGVVKINDRFGLNWETGRRHKIPAFLMTIN